MDAANETQPRDIGPAANVRPDDVRLDDRIAAAPSPPPRLIPKPWGHELIYAANAHFAGKILVVRGGHRISLQYHERKHETMYLRRGRAILTSGWNVNALRHLEITPGDIIDIPPGMLHRIEALEDCEIFEASTPDLDDLVRIADDYGRVPSGDP